MKKIDINKLENNEEKGCYEMVNSCLLYGESLDSHYITKYYKTLGEKRVKEICEEQKEHFKNHVIIYKNTYTDCDGISYNSMFEY